MPRSFRVAGLATATLCALTIGAIPVPSMAQEQPAGTVAASAVVASVLGDIAVAAPAASEFASSPASASIRAPARPASLASLVDDRSASDTRTADEECLATSVYFESKGEPLEGQLEVAQVVLNRAASGRFAGSPCGVVRQHGQFGFVRSGGRFPSIPRQSSSWRRAVAIAGIARDRLWKPVSADALYFNPARSARGSLQRVAELGRHVFYR